MSEANLCLLVFPEDIENDLRSLPLGLVLRELEIIVLNQPYNSLLRNDFNQLHLARVDVLKTVGELIAEFVGATFKLLRPPSTNVVAVEF